MCSLDSGMDFDVKVPSFLLKQKSSSQPHSQPDEKQITTAQQIRTLGNITSGNNMNTNMNVNTTQSGIGNSTFSL